MASIIHNALKADHEKADAKAAEAKKAAERAKDAVLDAVDDLVCAAARRNQYRTNEAVEALVDAYATFEDAERDADAAQEAAFNAFDLWWENRD